MPQVAYAIIAVSPTGDADRGRPLLWADSTQLARFPGDKGFNFARILSRGVQTPWPF